MSVNWACWHASDGFGEVCDDRVCCFDGIYENALVPDSMVVQQVKVVCVKPRCNVMRTEL